MNSTQGGNNDLTGTVQGPLAELGAIIGFVAIALYNVIVINVTIWLIFKRRTGLYFYSLVIASWGIVFHQVGFTLQFFGVAGFATTFVIMSIGWYPMTTGQAIVLYSRLHLVVLDRRKYRWVLYMIICTIFCFQVPTTTLLALDNSNPQLTPAYNIWQNIQVTAFSIQEFIISGLYINEARKMLEPSGTFRKQRIRTVMWRLIYVNILVIVLDIAVMCTQYAGLFQLHVVFKGAVYSIKLFVEFFVLNQLTEVCSAGLSGEESGPSDFSGKSSGSYVQGNTRSNASGLTKDEDGDQLGHSAFVKKSRAALEDSKSQSQGHVFRTTEVVVSSEQVEQSHSNPPSRKRNEWIELK